MKRMTRKNMRIYLPFGYISSNYATSKVIGIKHPVWIYETLTYIIHVCIKSCAALPIGSLKVHMAYTANAMVYKSAQGTAGHCQERPGSLGIMGPGSEQKGVLYSNLCWLFEGVMINRDFPCCFRLNHLYLKLHFVAQSNVGQKSQDPYFCGKELQQE